MLSGKCKRIPQQGRSLYFSFFFVSFDCSDTILTSLKTCLWNPGSYKHKIKRLSSAQFGLKILLCFLNKNRLSLS